MCVLCIIVYVGVCASVCVCEREKWIVKCLHIYVML